MHPGEAIGASVVNPYATDAAATECRYAATREAHKDVRRTRIGLSSHDPR
jgi:hypothetical protein